MLEDPLGLEKYLDPPKPKPAGRGRVFSIVNEGGPSKWSLARLPEIEKEFQVKFGKPIQYGRKGQGSGVGGWDHRNNADFGYDPGTPEAEWIMGTLRAKNIPFRATPLKGRQVNAQGRTISTDAHIHVGPPSGSFGRRAATPQAAEQQSDDPLGLERYLDPAPSPMPTTAPQATPIQRPSRSAYGQRAEMARTSTQRTPTSRGLLESGNIDLSNRPVVKNRDGSISTVRSMSVNMDGQEILIPTVSEDGRIMSEREAIEQYKKTGRHLGKFDSPNNATAYAQSLHRQQAQRYVKPSNQLRGTPPTSPSRRSQPNDIAQEVLRQTTAMNKAVQESIRGAQSPGLFARAGKPAPVVPPIKNLPDLKRRDEQRVKQMAADAMPSMGAISPEEAMAGERRAAALREQDYKIGELVDEGIREEIQGETGLTREQAVARGQGEAYDATLGKRRTERMKVYREAVNKHPELRNLDPQKAANAVRDIEDLERDPAAIRTIRRGAWSGAAGIKHKLGNVVDLADKTGLLNSENAGKARDILRRAGQEENLTAQISRERHPEEQGFAGSLGEGVGNLAFAAGPELILTAPLKAAQLPILGAIGAEDQGIGQMAKAAALGYVYHKGMQYTAPLGRVGNALFWTAAPALESLVENPDQTIGQAVGSNLPMGALAAGSKPVEVREGRSTRPATVEDLASIQKGELQLVDPPTELRTPVEAKDVATPYPTREIRERGLSTIGEQMQAKQPAEWNHLDFGKVTESPNQRGVPRGKVRVVDEAGNEHLIQRAKGTGAGNQRAIPVRRENATTEVQPANLPDANAQGVAEAVPANAIRPDALRPTRQAEGAASIPRENGQPTPLVRENNRAGVQPPAAAERLVAPSVPPVAPQTAKQPAPLTLYHGGSIKEGTTPKAPFFLSPREEIARHYAGADYAPDEVQGGLPEGTGVRKYNVRLESPLEIKSDKDVFDALEEAGWPERKIEELREEEQWPGGMLERKDVVEALREAGYDGAINHRDFIYDGSQPWHRHTSYVAFDSAKLEAAPAPEQLQRGKQNAPTRLSGIPEGVGSGRTDAARTANIPNVLEGAPPVRSGVRGTVQEGQRLSEPTAPKVESVRQRATPQSLESVTSLRNAQVNADRAELDLPELPKGERKKWQTSLDNAQERGLPARALGIAEGVLKKPRALSDEESAGMDIRLEELKSLNRKILAEAEMASPEELSAKKAELENIQKEFDTITQATKQSGTEAARTLAFRRAGINEDYDIMAVKQRAKVAKGSELTDEARAKFESWTKELEQKESQLSAREEALKTEEAQKAIGRIRDEASRERRRTQRATNKVELDAQFAQLSTQFSAKLENRLNANPLDPELIKIIGQMAKNRVLAGVNSVEGLVDEIHAKLKDYVDDKRQIRDAISGYGKTVEMSKDQIDVQLRDMRRQMRLISAIEDAEGGQRPARTGLVREKESGRAAELRKQLNEALKAQGLRQAADSLPAAKKSLETQIADIERQLEQGARDPRVRRRVNYDAEANQLKARRAALKKQLDEQFPDPNRDKYASIRRKIDELDAKIRTGDLSKPVRGRKPETDATMQAYRAERALLEKNLNELRRQAKPPVERDPLPVIKSRYQKQIAEFEGKILRGDYTKAPKREPVVYDRVANQLKAERDKLKQTIDAEIARIERAARPAWRKGLEAATNLGRVGLLSDPQTHVRNVSSNAVFQASEEVSRGFASIADRMAARKSGERTTYGISIPAATEATIKAAITEGPTRIKDIMLGREVLPLEGRDARGESTASKMQLPPSDTGFKPFDLYVNSIFRLLEAEDAVFKIFAFRRELSDIARAQAQRDYARDNSVNVRARAREIQQNPNPDMLIEASAYADYATFQNKNKVSSGIATAKRAVGPVGQFGIEQLAPFDRTPTNIIARTFEYSPLGFISAGRKYREFSKSAEKSKASQSVVDSLLTREQQKAFARTFGRASTGTVLSVLGMALAAKGLLKGTTDYDEDKADHMRKRQEAGGGAMLYIPLLKKWIYIGDTPIGKGMATSAAMYERMTQQSPKSAKAQEKDTWLKRGGEAVKAVANVAFEQPLVNAGERFGDQPVDEWLGNYLSRFIPGSGVIKRVAEVMDDKPRRVYGQGFSAPFKQRFNRSSLPVDERVNLEEYGGTGRRLIRAIDPFKTTSPGQGPKAGQNAKYDELRERARKGENITPELDRMVRAGEISRSVAGQIYASKDKSAAVAHFSHLKLEDAEEAFNAASEEEMRAFESILKEKRERKAREMGRGFSPLSGRPQRPKGAAAPVR